jgi:ABC-2 type transport system ATP-binding protein
LAPVSPIIEACNISKWYRQVIALNDVSVCVPGGIVGLLGPNGAGKTTFMRIVSGAIKPSRGTVKVLGEPIWNNHAMNRRIGYCADVDEFYEYMKAGEFLTYMVRLHGYDAAAAGKMALAALEMVKLADRKDSKIYGFSKGMRQRLKFAQALAHSPDLLLLDEPLVGTDPIVRRELISLIKDLARRGKSVIVSSHVLHEVEALTEFIVLIHRGRVRAEGNMHEIRTLIDRHPHSVRIETPQAREFGSALSLHKEVEAVTFDRSGAAFTVHTPAPDRFYAMLPSLAVTHKVSILGVTSPDDNLEAIFRYLVE